MSYNIRPDEHVAIAGRTGSGKTALLLRLVLARANQVLGQEYSVVILDTKLREDFDSLLTLGFHKTKHLADISRIVREGWNAIYAPEREQSPEYYGGLLRWAYNLGNVLVVVDELRSVASLHNIPDGYEDIMQRGRAKLVTLWAAIQNPVWTPTDFLSNPSHFFVFDLLRKADRVKMSEVSGEEVMRRPKDLHGFWYYTVHNAMPVYSPGLALGGETKSVQHVSLGSGRPASGRAYGGHNSSLEVWRELVRQSGARQRNVRPE